MSTAMGDFSKDDLCAAEQRLGQHAMRFRGTSDCDERDKIVDEYTHDVKQLIDSGNWNNMPAPEDMLPDNRMPKEFFEYWEL